MKLLRLTNTNGQDPIYQVPEVTNMFLITSSNLVLTFYVSLPLTPIWSLYPHIPCQECIDSVLLYVRIVCVYENVYEQVKQLWENRPPVDKNYDGMST